MAPQRAQHVQLAHGWRSKPRSPRRPPCHAPPRECAPGVHTAAASALLTAAYQPGGAAELAECAPFWVLQRLLARGDSVAALPARLASLGRELVQVVEARLLEESGGFSLRVCGGARGQAGGGGAKWAASSQKQHPVDDSGKCTLRGRHGARTSPRRRPAPHSPTTPSFLRTTQQESGPPCCAARPQRPQTQRRCWLSGAPPPYRPPPLRATRRCRRMPASTRCCRRLPLGLATLVSAIGVVAGPSPGGWGLSNERCARQGAPRACSVAWPAPLPCGLSLCLWSLRPAPFLLRLLFAVPLPCVPPWPREPSPGDPPPFPPPPPQPKLRTCTHMMRG